LEGPMATSNLFSSRPCTRLIHEYSIWLGTTDGCYTPQYDLNYEGEGKLLSQLSIVQC
jgi:hypothetical protein